MRYSFVLLADVTVLEIKYLNSLCNYILLKYAERCVTGFIAKVVRYAWLKPTAHYNSRRGSRRQELLFFELFN